MRHSDFLPIGLCLLLPIALSAGCGGSGKGVTASGTVTFNGQPVAKGYVTCYPEDGKSPPAGGEIVDGRFSVPNVTPGKNKLLVSSQPSTKAPDSMGDVKKSSGPVEGAIQAKDEGNSQVIDIGPDSNNLKLELRTSSSSSPPVKK
jgi:hypothetical protein